ncbi:hypothetical protein H7J86_26425 [Mycobacterium hackensackense]|uniref:putative phage holin n=1 Tax=Mycobacterium hackensackense TaxID=228909 RepID=UPI002265951E|nr:hypothetical protein [Mycobacterium hackensackense]MCV7255706.1 hypothetical protein [Mycobacterium hackensackense]
MRWLYVAGIAAIVGTFVADIWLTVDYELDANVSLLYLAALVTIFALLYGFRSNWRSSRVGKVFLIKCAFLSLVLWQIVLSAWWDSDYPFRQPIRFILYTAGAWTYASMVVQLIREQQRDRKRRREKEESSDG